MLELVKIQEGISQLEKENAELKKKVAQLTKENNSLKGKKRGAKEKSYREYVVKYRTLYMKYKHQQNNSEKIISQYKEIIRNLQAEIIQNTDEEDVFKKAEELNKLSI